MRFDVLFNEESNETLVLIVQEEFHRLAVPLPLSVPLPLVIIHPLRDRPEEVAHKKRV